MRTINEKFTDEEFQELIEIKNGDSWHDAILKHFRESKK
jgi:hypothetical protein